MHTGTYMCVARTPRNLALLTLAALMTAASASVATAQNGRCQAPRVLFTVDRSSSMVRGTLPDGSTKWSAARTALGEVASFIEDGVDFGLQVFPYPNRCEAGRVTVDVGNHSAATLLRELGEPPPSSGNYTPMAQTLDRIADYAPMHQPEVARHVVLITDGWQWCSSNDAPELRFTPVDSVTRLRALGITVHVVGFGESVDSLTLNRAAVAGGTALPGCDPMLDAPSAANHCYHQADDTRELRVALDSIAREITAEVCDSFDNDCDGRVDEGFDVDGDGYNTCGTNPLLPGVPGFSARVDCLDSNAAVNPGASEICGDGLDNDCDGQIDPGCDCTTGESRACGAAVGECAAGTQTCVNGRWGDCAGGVNAASDGDQCDGRDEDCDGYIDEDNSCGVGSVCIMGTCQAPAPDSPPPPPAAPPEAPKPDTPPPTMAEVHPGTMSGGCGCFTAGRSGSDRGAAVLGLIGLGLVILRRNRK